MVRDHPTISSASITARAGQLFAPICAVSPSLLEQTKLQTMPIKNEKFQDKLDKRALLELIYRK